MVNCSVISYAHGCSIMAYQKDDGNFEHLQFSSAREVWFVFGV